MKNQELETAETTEAEALPDTLAPKSDKSKVNFICLACEYATGTMLGESFVVGDQTLQYIKCCNEKCSRVSVVIVS
jgi:hypothetical protein